MLTELLERIFSRDKSESSRATVKQRLKILLAHDRSDLNPDLVEKMRQEILQVVARYVEIDIEESEFALESDRRTAALIANLPIRRVRTEEEVEANTSPSAALKKKVEAAIEQSAANEVGLAEPLADEEAESDLKLDLPEMSRTAADTVADSDSAKVGNINDERGS